MERRAVITRIIREEMDDVLETWDAEAGMHTVGWLPAGVDDAIIAIEAARAGLNTLAVSSFALGSLSRGGLLLGYAGFSPQIIKKGMRELASVIRRNMRSSRESTVKSLTRLNSDRKEGFPISEM